MKAADWDERYASTPLVWSAGPNALFAELTAALPPGRALDVACGEGRTALWLAEQGWQVTAVDFSAVGIDKGRERAQAAGVDIEWVVEDVTTADLGTRAYDLVAVLYLHLPAAVMADVLARSGAAVAPGGRLVVLGHDRTNLTEGVGGPQDPDILLEPEQVAAALSSMELERCERVRRETPDGVAVDTLVVARAPDPAGSPTGAGGG